MLDLKTLEAWFVTGSQHLYGDATLRAVLAHSNEIAAALSRSHQIPVRVVAKPVLTTPDAIRDLCSEASASRNCIGVIAWMHTFSPAKMWLGGLRTLTKPMVHLHTQYNADLPWDTIDMDFMNLNQSAHGDREFGFMVTRLRDQPEGCGGTLGRSGGSSPVGRMVQGSSRLARVAAIEGRPLW